MALPDKAAVAAQIDSLFAHLQLALADADARQRCALALQAVTELTTLREQCRLHTDRPMSEEFASGVDAALARASCLYDTFHQEFQYELEWASSGSAND